MSEISGLSTVGDMAARAHHRQEGNGDHIHIHGKHFSVTEGMKEHILLKIRKIEEMTPPALEVRVYLEVQREEHRVELEYKFSHFRIVISHVSTKRSNSKMDDMYHAIDMAFEKLKGKVRRWKTRIQDHHGKKPSEIEERSIRVLDKKTQDIDAINDAIEEETTHRMEEVFALPKIVRHKKRHLPMLTMDEATMRIDLSGDAFLVYRCQEDQLLKVMYVRRDKTLGIIDIE